MSARGARKRFLVALQREAETTGRNRFSVDELKEMLAACGGKSMPFFEVISALNTHGRWVGSRTGEADLILGFWGQMISKNHFSPYKPY